MTQARVMLAHELRAQFAVRMAEMYGREVPAYTSLVAVSAEVNADVIARDPDAAQRLGSIERVTAERHGAIRVGTPRELQQVAQIFAAFGMLPVGFYDLRDAAASAVPVVSTAFRPIDAGELARNPFRMFTSLLVTDDRRFFSADLQQRLDAYLAQRELFSPELLALAQLAIAGNGLAAEDAEQFLALATAAFELSREPVDRAWYRELSAVSSVAADIGGVRSTHLNHLTPRVLDIDDFYDRMSRQVVDGKRIEMIDAIQGPPRWNGAAVLLRQTSFRALDETTTFREQDGSLTQGSLRVRFGEVESRGVALTPWGRHQYDMATLAVDTRPEDDPASVWAEFFPVSEHALMNEGLAYYEVTSQGVRTPIVYEDFLPRSAAGIFQSNLLTAGTKEEGEDAALRDGDWLSDVIGAQVLDPFALYAEQQQRSIDRAAANRVRSAG